MPTPPTSVNNKTQVEASLWGRTSTGEPVDLYTLTSKDLTVVLSNLGGTIISIFAPDRNGVQADIVFGYDNPADYQADTSHYFGATIGRFANRIANGTFTINGERFQIPQNNETNALHGGPGGFDTKVWLAHIIPDGVEMTLTSEDGDMGFPGTLKVNVRFTLNGNRLLIEYHATTSKPTVVNLTDHSYFNLSNQPGDSILGHELLLHAEHFTPMTPAHVPSGELTPVANTPFDFRQAKPIGQDIEQDHEQLRIGGGYDHNFVVGSGQATSPVLIAEVYEPTSGRILRVETTEPGVQFYSGNFLNGSATGKVGVVHNYRTGICLETQHFPDSPNHPSFPSTLLLPDQTFRSSTVYSFDVKR
jgi:aldose 1-epimerase